MLRVLGSAELRLLGLLNAPQRALQVPLLRRTSAGAEAQPEGTLVLRVQPCEPRLHAFWPSHVRDRQSGSDILAGATQFAYSLPSTAGDHSTAAGSSMQLRVAERLTESPFTAAVPAQLLALYVARVGATVSFLQKRLQSLSAKAGNASADIMIMQTQEALVQQAEMLSSYRKASPEGERASTASAVSFQRAALAHVGRSLVSLPPTDSTRLPAFPPSFARSLAHARSRSRSLASHPCHCDDRRIPSLPPFVPRSLPSPVPSPDSAPPRPHRRPR